MKKSKRFIESTECIKNTFSNAHEGMKNISASEAEYLKNILLFLFETNKDLFYLFYLEISSLLKNQIGENEVKEIENSTKEKIVLLLPGFFSSCNQFYKIKKELDKTDIDYISIDERLTYFNINKQRKKILKRINTILAKSVELEKQIVIFGYSYGGSIGSHFSRKGNIPIVTYGVPLNPKNTPFSIFGNYYGIEIPESSGLDFKNGIHIVEEFSFANPINSLGDRKVIKSELSHFGVNDKKVVENIVSSIEKSF